MRLAHLLSVVLLAPVIAPMPPTNVHVVASAVPLPPAGPLPAPTNVRFEQGRVLADGTVVFPRVLWDVVNGAVAYEATLMWSSGRVIAQMPIMGLRGFPLPLGMPGHQYRFSVKACDVLPPAACTGAASPVMVVER